MHGTHGSNNKIKRHDTSVISPLPHTCTLPCYSIRVMPPPPYHLLMPLLIVYGGCSVAERMMTTNIYGMVGTILNEELLRFCSYEKLGFL